MRCFTFSEIATIVVISTLTCGDFFFAILTIFFDNHLVKLVFYLFEASSFDFKKSLLKLPSWHANKTEPNEIKTRTSTVCSSFYRRKLDVLKRKLVKSSSRWKNFQQS